MTQKMALAFGFWLLLVTTAQHLHAQESGAYRMVAGDTIEISYTDAADTVVARIDIDGEVRLRDIGGVKVASLTLDAAENVIEALLSKAGLFVDPQVTLTISQYAPIIVAGDVMTPGRYDYLPRINVTTAVGLAGGIHLNRIDSWDLARAQVAAKSQMMQYNLDIATAVVRVSGLTAFLEDSDHLMVDDEDRALIPQIDAIAIRQLILSESEILSNRVDHTAELLELWASEIEHLEGQVELFSQRMTVQNSVAARAAELLPAARDLQERGLQTSDRLTALLRREAETRARLLEIRSAKISTTRSISEVKRQRAQFLSAQRAEALAELRAARESLEEARLNYNRELEQMSILSNGRPFFTSNTNSLKLIYSLVRPRDNAESVPEINDQTLLLPGDTLIVDTLQIRSDR